MPTFTTIALENLLEPRVRDSHKKPLTGDLDSPTPESGAPRHLYISPALYATPELAPIPDVSSTSPSPYVANHKCRRGGSQGTVEVPELPFGDGTDGFGLDEEEEEVGDNFVNENSVGDDDVGDDLEGFADPRSEAMSVGSEVDVFGNHLNRNQLECRSFASAQGEFFDAIDEFSSDGSISNTPSYESRIESELLASRLSLLTEIERRKTAEGTLTLMNSQWERIRNVMSEAGFSFPAPPSSDSLQLENNVIDQMSQEVVVARFVAEVVGRGQARAEAEEAASAIIEVKDQEISRLRDRLQYYETVNHEMTQRKLVEVARRQHERKRSRRRWVWSLVGLSIAGASLAAYSCVPHPTEYLSLLKSGDSSDATSLSCSETSE